MISVNGTLIVQMIHFLFVWWFLDTFLFRLFIRQIQKNDASVSKLSGTVTHERALVQEEYGRKAGQWQRYRANFARKIPQIKSVAHLAFSTILCPIVFDIVENEKKQLVDATEHLLVEKVLNDKY